jgi:acetyl esterase/lipase
MILCPPLVSIVGYFINRRYAHIPYTGVHHEHLLLDVIVSKRHKPSDRSPVLLYLHGGAWLMGGKDSKGLVLANHVAQMGWVAVNADYRFVENFIVAF